MFARQVGECCVFSCIKLHMATSTTTSGRLASMCTIHFGSLEFITTDTVELWLLMMFVVGQPFGFGILDFVELSDSAQPNRKISDTCYSPKGEALADFDIDLLLW